jgi:hypothetical protein
MNTFPMTAGDGIYPGFFVMVGLAPIIHVFQQTKTRAPGSADKFTQSAQSLAALPGMTPLVGRVLLTDRCGAVRMRQGFMECGRN